MGFVLHAQSLRDGSWGASLISRVVSKNLELIDAPPALVAAEEIPVPYAAAMEERWLPRASDVVSAVQRAVVY